MNQLINLAVKDIEWIYIPPGAPHMGRCQERMIKSVKIALFAMIKEQNPTLNTGND